MAKKNRIPLSVIENKTSGALASLERMLEMDKPVKQQMAHINLEHLQNNHECFSEWGADELKDLSSFLDKLRKCDWETICKMAGMGYTKHTNPEALPSLQIR